MEFKRFEALIEKFPQIQIFSHDEEDLNRVITHFLKQQENVSAMSEAMQQKIKHALAPSWQQRFISIHDEEAILVKNLLLDKKFFLQTDRYIEDSPWKNTDESKLSEALEMAGLPEGILNRKLLSLSNGELRRVLLARVWMENPKWIYFNDLFGGLDPEFRKKLSKWIVQCVAKSSIKVVIRLARQDEFISDIPAFVYKDKIFSEYDFKNVTDISNKIVNKNLENYEIVELSVDKSLNKSEVLFDLKEVTVRFGETLVLNKLNWMVQKGEHWVVMGENGAGKSTLLGLLTGDHPQIYNNDITLLGKRPGHGLDIWEHKAKLGFFSPELSLQYNEDLDLLEVLCTGYTANLCRNQTVSWEEKKKAVEWLNYLGFENVHERFKKLSPIDKRLILMARAAIKPPKVLLLDEPTQGLQNIYRNKIFYLLQLLSKFTTIILVSHYEDEWPPCMTHLLKMPRFSHD